MHRRNDRTEPLRRRRDALPRVRRCTSRGFFLLLLRTCFCAIGAVALFHQLLLFLHLHLLWTRGAGSRRSASHKHISNYCALRWRARAVVSSIRPRSNSKEVPLEGHRYIEGIVLVIFAIFCAKDSSSPPEKGAAPRKALREENTKKISERKIAKITKSRECSQAHSGPRHLDPMDGLSLVFSLAIVYIYG